MTTLLSKEKKYLTLEETAIRLSIPHGILCHLRQNGIIRPVRTENGLEYFGLPEVKEALGIYIIKKSDYLLASIKLAAQLLDVSYDTIRRWDKKGILASERPGGKDRYFRIDKLQEIKNNKPLSISEAADRLGISVTTLRRLEERGMIKPLRNPTGDRLYTREMLAKFVQSGVYMPKKLFSLTDERIEDGVLDEPRELAISDNKKQITHNKYTSIVVLRNSARTLGKAWAFTVMAAFLFLALSTGSYIIYPKQTAAFYQEKTDRFGMAASVVRPVGKVSLAMVRYIDESAYRSIVPPAVAASVADIGAEASETDSQASSALKASQKSDDTGKPSAAAGLMLDAEGKLNMNGLVRSGSVSTEILADGSVTSEKLADRAVEGRHLAPDSVTSETVKDHAIGEDDLADGAVTGIKIGDSAVTSDKVKDGSIQAMDLAQSLYFEDGQFIDLSSVTHETAFPQGLRLPNVESQKMANPSEGEGFIVWDKTTRKLMVYDGSVWKTAAWEETDATDSGEVVEEEVVE